MRTSNNYAYYAYYALKIIPHNTHNTHNYLSVIRTIMDMDKSARRRRSRREAAATKLIARRGALAVQRISWAWLRGRWFRRRAPAIQAQVTGESGRGCS